MGLTEQVSAGNEQLNVVVQFIRELTARFDVGADFRILFDIANREGIEA